MHEFEIIVQIAVVMTVMVFPVVAAIRLVAGRDADQGGSTGLAWPIGVQEEEPQPWRLGVAS